METSQQEETEIWQEHTEGWLELHETGTGKYYGYKAIRPANAALEKLYNRIVESIMWVFYNDHHKLGFMADRLYDSNEKELVQNAACQHAAWFIHEMGFHLDDIIYGAGDDSSKLKDDPYDIAYEALSKLPNAELGPMAIFCDKYCINGEAHDSGWEWLHMTADEAIQDAIHAAEEAEEEEQEDED